VVSFPGRLKFVIAFALLALMAGWFWFYKAQEKAARVRVEEQLSSIGKLKAEEIAKWRAERLGDAGVLSESPNIGRLVERFLSGADGQKEAETELLTRFDSLRRNYGYDDIILADTEGHVALALSGRKDPHMGFTTVLNETFKLGKPAVLDIHADDTHAKPHVSFIAPIMSNDETYKRPLGAIVLICDASRFLFPLIQSWPTPNKTCETLLVRREGDNVLYLNELRHQKDTVLKLSIPLTRTDLPAVMAVLGRTGIFEGRDYRGVEVISYIQEVPGSNWFIVSKEDTKEIFKSWRQLSVLIILLSLLSVLSTIALVFVMGLKSEKANLEGRLAAESKLREMTERHAITLKSIGDAVISCDSAGIVQFINHVAEELTGWREAEAKGKRLEEVFDIVNEDTRDTVESPVAKVLREGVVVGLANHTLLIARDGTERAIADSGAPIRDASDKTIGVVLVFRDQTEERAKQRSIEESEDKFKYLFDNSTIGKSITSPSGEIRVNRAFCDMLGYSAQELAEKNWQEITVAEDIEPTQRLLDEIMAGRKTAMRMIKRYIHKNGSTVWTDLSTALRRDEGGKPLYFLTSVINITDRKLAENELQKSEKRLREVQDMAQLGHWTWDIKTGNVEWSEEVFKIFHLEPKEFKPHIDSIQALSPWPEDHERDKELIRRAIENHEKGDYEQRFLRPDKSTGYYYSTFQGHYDVKDNLVSIVGTVMDITERKRAEEALALQARIVTIFLTVSDDEMFNEVLKVVLDVMRSPFGVFGYLDEAGALVVPTMTRQIWDKCQVPDKTIVFPRSTWGDSSWPRAIREKKLNYSNEESSKTPEGHVAVTRHISLPLLFQGEVIGLLQVANKTEDYTESDISTLKAIAKLVAPPLSARLQRERAEKELQAANQQMEASNQQLRATEQQLEAGMERLADAQTIARLGSWEWDAEKDVINGSDEFYRLFGVGNDQLGTFQAFIDRLHPDDIEHVERDVQESLTKKALYDTEYRVRISEGDYRHIHARGKIFADDKGKPVRLVGTCLDITERKRAEEALNLSQERLFFATEGAQIGIWNWDVVTGELIWSDRCKALFGIRPDETMSYQRFSEALHPDDRDRTDKAVKDALDNHKDYNIDYRSLWPDGSIHWLAAKGRGYYDAAGKTMRMEGVVIDISERKRMEEELLKFNTKLEQMILERTRELQSAQESLQRQREEQQIIFDSVPAWIFYKDKENRFIRVNQAFSDVMGMSKEQLEGKAMIDLYPKEQADAFWKDDMKVVESGRPKRNIIESMDSPEGTLWVQTDKIPYRDAQGNIAGIIGCTIDITELKNAENKITKLNEQLNEKIGQLEGVNKELEAFSYSVSHDLRAPLRAVDGYTRILLEDYESSLDDEGKRVCSVISEGARGMGRLIDDLLAFSRTGRTNMQYSDVNMTALAKAVFFELTTPENRKRVDFHVGQLPLAHGDPTLIKQVFMNLLSNAVKFSSKIKRAEINVDAEQIGEETVYTIKDNGAGFDMRYVEKLFGVFQRLHSTREFEGTGIGLAIVQRIIKRHGGRVWAEGKIDGGATFYFSFKKGE
jgi:PAS domain S-box-containing protein